MDNGTEVVTPDVVTPVEAQVVPSNLDVLDAQRANFAAQLEQVKKEMVECQQKFDAAKTKGIKLEGAIESLDILKKSLPK